ncbi:putative protein C10orf12-like protein [Labeo rohita]|uniref:Uncharacterized protein n=1 Tax=Labeo rohita TaxID=84645 RepID=A0A498NWM6_LABRO|nr:putative protein C10orf12-like protein [Labeo rohita]
MASSCTKRFCTNEGFIIRRDADSWSSELIRSVGLYNISEVFSETQVLRDLSALKEYTPKIPDPHIPVVACGIVQQMINELASYYTSRKNSSQDALQNNGKKDQSLVKPSCVTSSPAVKIDSVASAQKKFIMVDQDAPLDLSLRKVKVEDFEQVVQEKHMNMVEENTETTELVVQKEGCGSQMGPMPEEVVCGPENKAEEDKSMEPSPIPPSPNMAKECSTDEVNVEQRNERHLKKPTEVETAADVQEQSEASEIKANSEEDGGAQGQGVLDTEAGAGSSHGIFPSLQAERLKKHLKKFAIASPVKNNPKNQRLLSKALGQGISAMRSKEKHEPTTATRICTKAQSLAGAAQAQAPESLAVTAGSAKNPASARILRKYSNMREKLQVQQNKKCKEKTFKGARLKAAILPKKANKQKLTTRKASKSVVQRISSLTKTAKTNSALKQRALKRNPCHKDGASPKRLQALKRMTKAIGALDKSRRPNTLSKKRTLIKTGTSKAQQMKASLTKVDTKKPVFQKGPSNLESQSSDVDVKPLTLEDQVLTRSQRKMEGTPSQTGSPKSSTKRGLEPLVTPSKRTRTSKP